MSNISPKIVAIIGQTNAGKSTLLNRLAKQKIAITAREAGTTRDNVSTLIDNAFLAVDTAGLKDPKDDFEASIQDQIMDSIDSADLILIVADGTKPINHDDTKIAKMALKSQKPVLLALNKSDLGDSLPETDFLKLGIKLENILKISATTNYGVERLKSEIKQELKIDRNEQHEIVEEQKELKIALIGRPNVGKSSLFNTLAKKQQAIVANLAGTTRDINRIKVKYKEQEILLLDTAGLRKKGKREVGIEKFSAIKALAAIAESDVCCLVIDATDSRAKLEQSLAGEIVNAGKGVILVITKTDLIEDNEDFSKDDQINYILRNLERDYNFLPYAPVLFTSSETGKNATKIFELGMQIQENREHKIPTSDLNRILNDAVMSHAPAGLKNTNPKPKYIVQTDTCPPWFVIHGHDLGLLHWSWKRFLERKIREFYPFSGSPINISTVSDDEARKNRKK